jgi:hypothetical protein
VFVGSYLIQRITYTIQQNKEEGRRDISIQQRSILSAQLLFAISSRTCWDFLQTGSCMLPSTNTSGLHRYFNCSSDRCHYSIDSNQEAKQNIESRGDSNDSRLTNYGISRRRLHRLKYTKSSSCNFKCKICCHEPSFVLELSPRSV